MAFVSFGSIWMLLWASAALLPVLIHLWNRRKHAETSWAAMEYLLAAIRNNARRMRFQQLFLLAVRVLTLVLLATALANPIISAIPGLGPSLFGPRRTHTVLVLDGSYSMDFRHADLTRFETARQMAIECVRQGRHGDAFTLVLMGEPAQTVIETPTFDRDDVIGEIESASPAHAGADLHDTMGRVEGVIRAASAHPPDFQRTQIYVFTDLGRTTWRAASDPRCRQQFQTLGQQASIVVVDVGQPGVENLAITTLTQHEAVATAGRTVQFQATIQNFGQSAQMAHPVELYVDDRRVDQKLVDVAAGEEAAVGFVFRFEPGEHAVEARLGEDQLQLDNHRYRSVPVRDAVRVLCVGGRYGAARHVALALAPDNSDWSRVHTQVISDRQLRQVDLQPFDCVFFCNVGRFDGEESTALRRYLQTGGGLVFFLGDQVQAENYNLRLGAQARQGRILPATIGTVVDEARYLFDPRGYTHPIVSPFRGHERAGLLTTPIWRYMQLEPDVDSKARVALGFDSGDAAIVEAPSLGGHAIVVATSATDMSVDLSPWTALATWPSFPPLVHELLAAAMAQRDQDRNLHVGDSIESAIGDPASEPSLMIVHRDQKQRVRMTVEGTENRWTFPETGTSGIYRADFQPPTIASQLFAVNVDTRESDLRRVDAAGLPRPIRSAAAGDTPAILAAGIGRTQWPLFRVLLGAVLGLLLVETFLAWYFSRARV